MRLSGRLTDEPVTKIVQCLSAHRERREDGRVDVVLLALPIDLARELPNRAVGLPLERPGDGRCHQCATAIGLAPHTAHVGRKLPHPADSHGSSDGLRWSRYLTASDLHGNCRGGLLARSLQCGIPGGKMPYIRWHGSAAWERTMGTIKTSVNLPEETVDALREISEESGSSMAEVLRRAISTEKYLYDTVREGGKILIQDKNKNMKELLIRSSLGGRRSK
ncbi:MAG TPA: ribbon-helix-helix protein, CopG family [Vicinamibacterales bacterium]|nr:ribbon-helix-helix protein, CopG family [Vicinamibacterales bacterium]